LSAASGNRGELAEDWTGLQESVPAMGGPKTA